MICQKKITNLKIDESISKEIEKVKSDYEANFDLMPTAIYYNKGGSFEWKKQEEEQKEGGENGSNEMDNEDEVSLSMGNIE